MQSTDLSRGLFGPTRIWLIHAALLAGALALSGSAGAQEPESLQRPSESPALAEQHAAPPSLRELTQEPGQKTPQLPPSFHAWQASRNGPQQVSTFPESHL